ncbi:MAG: beta galactosidase jelly roll domain-containing protein [Prolixibacteraceae bacterium]|nr:beta galactosidase jelly roll domain-containing protein [Prolixibacteraceae bacterium]
MKTKQPIILLFFLGMLLLAGGVKAADWSRITDLEGMWYFTVGDDMNWSKPDLDHSKWDKMFVPDNWDEYYRNYNGYGWYRKTFDVTWIPEKGDLMLFLGQVDDVDEVFINGVKVGQSGSFPPNFQTAYNHDRRYLIPRDLLKKTGNTIAVRVYDTANQGGIVRADRIGIYYDDDINLLMQDLSGTWKWSAYRENGMHTLHFDDKRWKSIKVPGPWDPSFDGLAWYRNTFRFESKNQSGDLYLVLGKIDDFDKVYLNGELIGRTEYLDRYSRYNRGNAWRLYRVYRIPKSQLKPDNVLVVEVQDDQLDGGIYEGPVGIVNARDAQILLNRSENEDFWYNPVRFIFDFFNF